MRCETSGYNVPLTSTMVVFVCPGCGVVYGAVQQSCTKTRVGQFRCTSCDAVVYSWSAGYTYIGWAPVDLAQSPGSSRSAGTKKKRARKPLN